jgi:membrane protein
MRKLCALASEIYTRSKNDDVPALGAQVAYNFLLSFFPFLIFLVTLLSYSPVTSEDVLNDILRVLPRDVYELVADIIRQTTGVRSGTLLSFGMAATVWVASNGVLALIRGINRAYDSDETRPFWKTRGLSILFTLVLALVIFSTLTLLVFGKSLGEYLFYLLGFSYLFGTTWLVFRFAAALAVLVLVFAFLYRYMPNHRLKFRDVVPGSLFATAGWVVISLIFSYYIDNFTNFTVMYGGIGGVIVLLLWLYWSSIIILLGGEVNASLAFE